MTNEEKANEIARDMLPYNNAEYHACYNSAIKAMEWKDEHHTKEKESFFKEYRKEILDACIYDFEQKKQQWIEKACDFFYNELNNGNMDCSDIECFIKKFKKIIINYG